MIDPFPADEAQRPAWVQRSLRFGMVLRDPTGRHWLNLTQVCDLAQAAPQELPQLSLLLIAGAAAHPARQEESGNTKLRMAAPMVGAGAELITWHLRQISTPSVQSFANAFAGGWVVTGELRLDQAQSVVASYGAQAARVGLQRPVRSWGLSGVALTAGALNAAAAGTAVQGFPLHGQALHRGKEHELHFDLATYSALQQQFPGAIDEAALRICSGVLVKPGKSSQGTPHIVHCVSAPASVDDLRTLVADPHLLRAENAAKVILAVWAA